MMQVLVRKSDVTSADCACAVCGQGFRLYWERGSEGDRTSLERQVRDAIHSQHMHGEGRLAHPEVPFTVPNWPGMPQFSGSFLLERRKTPRTAEADKLQRAS